MRQAEQKGKGCLTVKEKKRKEKRGEGGERRRRRERRRERGSSDQGADAVLHTYYCSKGLASRLTVKHSV